MARATTDRKDIASIMDGGDMDLSDAAVLRGNARNIFTYTPPDTAIKFYNDSGADTIEFKFTKDGIDIDVQGRILDSARLFLKVVSELQNEYILVKKR